MNFANTASNAHKKTASETAFAIPERGPVMLDVAGKTLTDEERRRIAHPLTGGLILFARNFETRKQLFALVAEIRAIRPTILIAVDHEGGRVQRFKTDGFTVLPAMRKLGELWDRNPIQALHAAVAIGYVLAAELRACGIDFSFTPLLDIDYGHSEVIGNRAFHADPTVIATLAQSLNQGMALAGMANCGKHFPGHGYAEADSHHALPVDTRTLEEIMGDTQPYSGLGLALAAIMPAHIQYVQVDKQPAGFSPFWLNTILREQLGFTGAILSDDLSMQGARAMGSVLESAQAALTAGCDMVLVCNHPEETDLVLAGLRPPAASVESHRRLARLAAREPNIPQCLPDFNGAADLSMHEACWEALQQQPEYQNARSTLNMI